MRISSLRSLVGLVAVIGVGGCKDLTGSPGLPSGTPSPSFYANAAGAHEMRNAAVYEFEQMLPQYVVDAGLLTDELEDPQTGASPGQLSLSFGQLIDPLDERILNEESRGGKKSYDLLQGTRTMLLQAIGALAAYDSGQANTIDRNTLRGELYGLEGYDELLLADLFCSGVPLGTLDFNQDFTYHAGSPTAQVYQDAQGKFDSALALVPGDSVRLVYLAQVGKGRALLAQGQYAAAAQAVGTVPGGYSYQLTILVGGDADHRFTNNFINNSGLAADREGGNGLPFRSNGDPRTFADTFPCIDVQAHNLGCFPTYFPAKYGASLGGYGPLTLASGVEARLIQAEAALHANDPSWLTQLNALRTDGTFDTSPDPIDPTKTDTTWHAGTGGVNGLRPLVAPATPPAMVDLLFTERAAWLYMTGTRQGDLRRLIRQYDRDEALVYPAGRYLAPGEGTYGGDVTAPIPMTEYVNPLYHGCLNRNA